MAVTTFERREFKYLLTPTQYESALRAVSAHLLPDKHGETTIQSLYLDTADFHLVNRSIEQPLYKEKIRLRAYGPVGENSRLFLELKKKSEGVVFKRRIELSPAEAEKFVEGCPLLSDSQIAKEIGQFRFFYGFLEPKVLLLYDRAAFYDPNSELRITFDRNVRYRTERLFPQKELDGIPLEMPPGAVLMEIKAEHAVPFALARFLSEEGIRKASFSKYGTFYQTNAEKITSFESENLHYETV